MWVLWNIPGDLVVVLLPHSDCSNASLSRGGIAGASATTHGHGEGVVINRICEDKETRAQNIWVINSKALAIGTVCLASNVLIRSDMMFSEDSPPGNCVLTESYCEICGKCTIIGLCKPMSVGVQSPALWKCRYSLWASVLTNRSERTTSWNICVNNKDTSKHYMPEIDMYMQCTLFSFQNLYFCSRLYLIDKSWEYAECQWMIQFFHK